MYYLLEVASLRQAHCSGIADTRDLESSTRGTTVADLSTMQ